LDHIESYIATHAHWKKLTRGNIFAKHVTTNEVKSPLSI